jgi:hypothetical protein
VGISSADENFQHHTYATGVVIDSLLVEATVVIGSLLVVLVATTLGSPGKLDTHFDQYG